MASSQWPSWKWTLQPRSNYRMTEAQTDIPTSASQETLGQNRPAPYPGAPARQKPCETANVCALPWAVTLSGAWAWRWRAGAASLTGLSPSSQLCDRHLRLPGRARPSSALSEFEFCPLGWWLFSWGVPEGHTPVWGPLPRTSNFNSVGGLWAAEGCWGWGRGWLCDSVLTAERS